MIIFNASKSNETLLMKIFLYNPNWKNTKGRGEKGNGECYGGYSLGGNRLKRVYVEGGAGKGRVPYIDMIGLCKAKVFLSKSLPKLDITKFKGRLSPLN